MRAQNKSSEDRAYCEIMAMILPQELPPGSIVMEAVIAERLKMSRTPIRAALRRLVSSGLLEITSNRSSAVPILTRKDWDDLFDLRLRIEPRIAELAAEKYDGTKNDFLQGLIEIEKQDTADGGVTLQDVNEKLHFGIAELADNKYMYNGLQQVFWRCQLYVCFFDSFLPQKQHSEKRRLENPLERRSISQHEEIVAAILNRDAERAGIVMRDHILSTYERTTTFLS